MSYKHLTLEERYHIQAYKEAGYKQNEIAKKIGVDPSTISRELQKNSSKIRQYLPKKTDFTKVDYKTIKMIQNRLNNRPRKALGFKTPREALLI